LLVLDNFGLQTIHKEFALAILQILEDRYSKKSTIIVSQLPVEKWAQVISDATIGDDIVDRIIYNAHRIELKGSPMREKTKQNGGCVLCHF
jgi:DNA replication protein DnaC